MRRGDQMKTKMIREARFGRVGEFGLPSLIWRALQQEDANPCVEENPAGLRPCRFDDWGGHAGFIENGHLQQRRVCGELGSGDWWGEWK